jgi:hypothetical protein
MIEHPLTGISAATEVSMADIPVQAVLRAATGLLTAPKAKPQP